MALSPKFAAPVPPTVEYLPRVLASAVEGRTTLFAAAPGYLPTAQIAAALACRKTPTLWLRLGRDDIDPGILLTSLIDVAAHANPEIGKSITQQMIKKPGPVNGWAPLFTLLAQEMKAALPPASALVIEHLQQLPSSSMALQLLSAYFLPLLPEDMVCILTSHIPIQPGILQLSIVVHDTRELRIDEQGALAHSHLLRAGLTDRDVLHLHTLADGRPSLLMNLLSLAASIDPQIFRRAIDQAHNVNDLLIRLARDWMKNTSPEAEESTLLAMRLEYLHPSLGQISPHPVWMQSLDGEWSRIQCSWNLPLVSALPSRGPSIRTMRLAAEALVREGLVEQAVPLFIEAGDASHAAEVLSASVTRMIDLGQWQTLDRWLKRIPEKDLSDWPWLVYARGEILASRNEIPKARRSFTLSTEQFRRHGNPQGACQSLLTESALAFWQGEKTRALDLALIAQAEARAANLDLFQSYAAWQLGCLYASDELYGTALMQFEEVERLSAANQDLPLSTLSSRAVALIQAAQELHQQGNAYRQALASTEASMREALGSIHHLISTPAGNLGDFLSDRGWSRTPLNLKIQPSLPPVSAGQQQLRSMWQALLNVFDRNTPTQDSQLQPHLPGSTAVPDFTPPTLTESGQPSVQPASQPELAAQPHLIGVAPVSEPDELDATTGNTIVAFMLGRFEVKINGQLVLSWSGGRGRSVFQYLLTYHQRPRTREAIMDVFWQDASPESARNNLNVALYSLRGSLRSASSLPVVQFEDGRYRLNPEFKLWLDVDEFERCAAQSQQAEQSGDIPALVESCEAAIRLYQDDFLSAHPLEEWTILPRERLRVAYMEILDRLSRVYLAQGEYIACSRLCLMMLDRDRCWEDAHTRLMRCYTRQGNYDLAIRQYQACQEALRKELNVEPSEETEQLYQKIRRREEL